MIGNDVIDLALAEKESNWKRKGFLHKIFTPKEQLQILNSEKPDIKVWELWSRKEAAYKIWNRKTGIRLYNPLKFECSESNFGEQEVIFENFIFYTRTLLSDHCIKTIAVSRKSDFDKIFYLKNRSGIAKKNGIPMLNDKAVSISNHGRFEQIISIL